MLQIEKEEWWEEYFQRFVDGFEIKFSEGITLSTLRNNIQKRQDDYSSVGEFRLRDICKKQIKMIDAKLKQFKPKE